MESYVGKKFNKLTILKDLGIDSKYRRIVEAQCDCEKQTIFTSVLDSILKGRTKGCGCLKNKDKKKFNTYNLIGKYGIGYTAKGEEFYFDLEDYNLIKDVCWYKNKDGYIVGRYKTKYIMIHNLIMDSLWIDHIYHNKYDNRKENLRVVTNQQNLFNTKGRGKLAKFGVKGISWSKQNKKWDCGISKNNKIIGRKFFNNIIEAIIHRIELEKEHFGEHRYIWENTIKWGELLEYEKSLQH